MAAYSDRPRNRYGFIRSRPAINPVIASDGRTGPVSSDIKDGNGESNLTVKTTAQRVPPSDMPAGSYEAACDRLQIIDEFPKKIQTEVSQSARPPARAAPTVQFGLTTCGDVGDFTNGLPRPVTESGHVVQSHVTPPAIRMIPTPPMPNAKISHATNDITEAMEYLKEFTRPSTPNNHTITVPQNMVPAPAAVNKDSAPVTMNSQEVARRYPNVIVLTEPYGKESSTPALDCKTARDKYGGVFV